MTLACKFWNRGPWFNSQFRRPERVRKNRCLPENCLFLFSFQARRLFIISKGRTSLIFPCPLCKQQAEEKTVAGFTASWIQVRSITWSYRVGFEINNKTNALGRFPKQTTLFSALRYRFHLRSSETGFMAACYEIGVCVSIPVVTYVGGRGHKPLWIGWGMFIMGAGSIVFSLPHFIASSYVIPNIDASVCNTTITCDAEDLRSMQ